MDDIREPPRTDEEVVVLVDPQDVELGTSPKLQAHREGRLHRAISVFVFNRRGELLLQRRAPGKYHSGGLWANACCSHPRPGEEPHRAAIRRLHEEMGLRVPLQPAFSFIYRAAVGPELIEHELDHVFVGVAETDPRPDPEEVVSWRWTAIDDVRREVTAHPERFSAWFPLAFARLLEERDEGDRPLLPATERSAPSTDTCPPERPPRR